MNTQEIVNKLTQVANEFVKGKSDEGVVEVKEFVFISSVPPTECQLALARKAGVCLCYMRNIDDWGEEDRKKAWGYSGWVWNEIQYLPVLVFALMRGGKRIGWFDSSVFVEGRLTIVNPDLSWKEWLSFVSG